MTPEGSKEFMDDLRKRSLRAARKHKITIDRLFKKLNEELEAHETKSIKVKGAINPKDLPPNRRLVVESGIIEHRKEGDTYGDGDSVIEWDEINWKVRQEARRDAEAHLGIKPAEKVEHDLSGSLMAAVAAYLSGKKE
ncbi:MAG: hypothetical protein ABIJ57_15735 [Pseudomonadota bacterium]